MKTIINEIVDTIDAFLDAEVIVVSMMVGIPTAIVVLFVHGCS
jgi:hypothetical protein